MPHFQDTLQKLLLNCIPPPFVLPPLAFWREIFVFFLLPVCVCVFDPLLSGKVRLSFRVGWQLHPHPPI